MIKRTLALAAAMAISLPASAVTDTNRTVTSVGVQGNQAYFTVSPALSGSCLYDIVYILDLANSGKFLYGNLISAYSAGLVLQRVDYTVLGNGTCQATLVNF